jgi:hypothetical protein
MKKLALTLSVLFVFFVPGVSPAAGADLSGNWTVTVTMVCPYNQCQKLYSIDAREAVQYTMNLQERPPGPPEMYDGTFIPIPPAPTPIGCPTQYITVVQDGKEVRFTIACPGEALNSRNFYVATTWGTGIVGKNHMSGTCSNIDGSTGTFSGSRQGH